MPTCRFCDEQYPEGAADCPHCGAALRSLEVDRSAPVALSKQDVRADGLPEALETELVSLLQTGKKIQAIKRLRDATGCGLKEAKEQVEALAVQRKITSPTPAGCGTAVLFIFAILSCGWISLSLLR